jgi:glycosyltransferase involved in cell wall biosynthesis
VSEAHPSLLLLVPAYNEAERIEPVLREFAEYYSEHYDGPFELVVVLNGCRDNTREVVEQVEKQHSCVRYLNYDDPIGKGGALIEGLRLAPRADLIGYVDADGATSPKALHDLARLCEGEVDCVIGSRWLPGSVLHQSQTWVRRRFSRCFHAIVQLLFRMNIEDTQCPAKVIRRPAVERIHDQLQIADLAFDVNLLYALHREGFMIKEVATEWTDKVGSKVTESLLRSSMVMFLSVVRLRLVYSPFYTWLAPLRPLETWLYAKLRAPRPRSSRDDAEQA